MVKFLLIFACWALNYGGFVNENVARVFESKGNILFVTITVQIGVNSQLKSDETYSFIEEFAKNKISALSFTLDGKQINPSYDSKKKTYSIPIRKGLSPNEKQTLVAKYLLTQVAYAKPGTITQDEQQFARLDGNLQYNSSYPTKEDDLVVHVYTDRFNEKSANIEFDKDSESFSNSQSDVEPYAVEKFFINYYSPTSFVTITNYTREVIVSPVAACRFEETYVVQNSGAKLVGEYSRFKLMVSKNTGAGTIESFTLNIPPESNNFYYRDEIGNISTSKLATAQNHIEFTVFPRFPLQGGWKIGFYLGYYIPLGALGTSTTPAPPSQTNVVFSGNKTAPEKASSSDEPRKHSIYVPFAPSIQRAAAEYVELRVALPEGAHNVRITVPFANVERLKDEKLKHTMDYLGRQVIVLRATNVVYSPYYGDVRVDFDLPALFLVHKPVILAVIIVGIVAAYLLLSAFIRWFTHGTIGKRVVPAVKGKKGV